MSKSPDYRQCSLEGLQSILGSGGESQHLQIVEEGTISVDFDNYHFRDSIFDKSISWKGLSLTNSLNFTNCVFNDTVTFIDVTFWTGAKFIDCTFKKKLVFSGCTINELKLEGGQYNFIEINGSNKEVPNGINKITLSTSSCERLNITSKDIGPAISFENAKIHDIHFSRIKFNGALAFDKLSEINDIYSQSCVFSDRLDFNAKFPGTVYFHKCQFDEQVVFNKEFKCNSLSLNNVQAKQNVSVHYVGNISSLDISAATFNALFNCYSRDDDEYDDNVSVSIDGFTYGNILFEQVYTSSISLAGINFGNIIFNQVRSRMLFIQEFHNRNRVTISNMQLATQKNVLLIFDSSISQMEFVNIDFTKFEEVVVAKSDVSNMILSNSYFPRKIQIKTNDPRLGFEIKAHEKINDHLYFRESYRQLKLAMERQGNRNEALHYKSLEMHYLRKELKFGWDKLLLILNFLSNNHGTSWSRGVWFTISMTVLFFAIYLCVSHTPLFYWDMSASFEQTQQAFFIGLDKYFEYLSTFPRLAFDSVTSVGWKTNLVILLSRIFVGYGIFQTVVAFRKYGGSSV